MESINHTHSHPNYHPPNNKKSGWFHNLLNPVRNWLDGMPVKNSRLAHVICQVIPCCCPFERNISLFGRTLHIPPLCKLNPLYDEFVGMRFRALSYLADECGEDITKYIC
ncbi:Mo-dependent nitrogenase C-terminal domain-containing protein [Nodularia spumigena]|uniref:Nitrogenase n=1 Tax=Nodularia spumigena CENA596 TaxID=1819295 RepID=A0A166KDN4_NODSP|nr:Mo-dependent nitrogenase C-terminal domain-containing protein [Nodularia spumigena]MDB9356294.1 Mo-dependent nitrogenase C-terminal domain-containing protein [Nodularia spumigena CS-587/03]KZL50960.1 nitrogenase [Nodularia spumigena CENA596]MDB9304048.1 Mo-dependent nitrogenase C-terminal domain-containing protein [Nodularia spumigena CS-591/12]MDB9321054.1 Mo-dependent nitrogenase C-terminal domain-containing protein [Nodularia spumigena CS-591/07A]MDB9330190.1 Mo-dependent nitrogenase C-t